MRNGNDSVVNYLTPTKLITGSLKPPKPRPSLNESQFTNSSHKHKSIPPLEEDVRSNYNNQFDKSTIVNRQRTEELPYQEKAELRDSSQPRLPVGNNYVLENTSKTMLKSEDNFRMLAQERVEPKPREILNEGSIKLFPVEVTKEKKEPEFIMDRVNSGYNSRVLDSQKVSLVRENPREQFPPFSAPFASPPFTANPNKPSESRAWQGSTEELQNLIGQLKSVKELIDGSLSELQLILDNTSKFLQDIDEEYGRVKQRILDYTSQVLDGGFRRYRENMVDWSKYEQVERKAQLMSQQLEKTVREDEVMVQEMGRLNRGTRMALAKQTELEEKLQLYGHFATDLTTMKTECLNMRPHLRRDRIMGFEQALAVLVDF